MHQISKMILFKKKDKIKFGKIKEILENKIGQNQFGYKEGSDCNVVKILSWYNIDNLDLKTPTYCHKESF